MDLSKECQLAFFSSKTDKNWLLQIAEDRQVSGQVLRYLSRTKRNALTDRLCRARFESGKSVDRALNH